VHCFARGPIMVLRRPCVHVVVFVTIYTTTLNYNKIKLLHNTCYPNSLKENEIFFRVINSQKYLPLFCIDVSSIWEMYINEICHLAFSNTNSNK
jgi:hypothetical protein